MSFLRRMRERLIPYRWHFFAITGAGLAICVALIFSSYSTAGFALAGPLVIAPYGLSIAAFSKPSKWMPQELLPFATLVALVGACLGIAWFVMVIVG